LLPAAYSPDLDNRAPSPRRTKGLKPPGPPKFRSRLGEARAHVVAGSGGEHEYLRAAEAAAYLNVSPKTVSRWAKEGKVPHIVTLGGHRRFPRREIERLARQLAAGERRFSEQQ
jgi:excisionase family DNA binding protein